MDIRKNTSIHNRFEFKLIDSVTGEVKQTAIAENTVINNIWNYLLDINSSTMCLFDGVAFGDGSGEPSSSDTALFHQLFAIGSGTVVETVYDDPTSYTTKSFGVPASSAYVGNLTEVGAMVQTSSRSTSRYLMSHAMIVDSEGHPIVIEKTELDILIVNVTVYVTITNNATDLLLLDPSKRAPNCVIGVYSGYTYMSKPRPILYQHNPIGGLDSSHRYNNIYGTSTSDIANKKASFVGNRVATSEANLGYFNYLGIEYNGYVEFPNSDVFAPYTMRGASIGTGDGSTQNFNCPVDLFIKDTDVVYKNGVALTRGVDYTIDNFSNHNLRPELAISNFSENDPPTDGSSRISYARQAFDLSDVNNGLKYGTESVVKCKLPTGPQCGIPVRVNAFYLKDFYITHTRTYGRYADTEFSITIEKSSDGETWEHVADILLEESGWSGSGSDYKFNGYVTFDEVTSGYLRVKANKTYLENYYYEVEYQRAFFGYVGEKLHFTNPPANGDVLTMDCTIDRPFKNENFVMDVSLSITYS